jgi:hypothetical protein
MEEKLASVFVMVAGFGPVKNKEARVVSSTLRKYLNLTSLIFFF